MSVEFFDGCGEYYDTGQIPSVWDVVNGAAIVSATGRTAGNAIRLNASAVTVGKGLPRSQSKVFGFDFQLDILPGSDSIIFQILGDETLHGTIQVSSTGELVYKRGAASAELLRSGVVISTGTYVYIECKVLISDTVGTVEILLDGVPLMSGTSLDTRDGGPSDIIAAFNFKGQASRLYDFDNVYVDNANFHGPVRMDAFSPDGDAVSTQWDTVFPASPTTHYTKVDDNPHTDDTDYIETPTNGDVDLFDFEPVPAVSGLTNVVGLKVIAAVNKDDAGSGNFRLLARPDAVTDVGATRGATVDYRHHEEYWNLNPDTSLSWTISEIDAGRFGVEKIA